MVLAEIASAQEKAGDTILGLLTRLRVLALADPAENDYQAALADATTMGNRAVVQVPGIGDERARVRRACIGGRGVRSLVPPHDLGDRHHPGGPGHQGGEGGRFPGQGDRQRVLHRQARLHSHESPRDRERGGSEVQGVFAPVRPSLREPRRERIPAKVVGYDKAFDLALIKTEITPDYVFGGWSGQTLTPGDRIFAIGSPAGLEKTITSGIISAMGRRLLQVGDSMQVDVPLNPGNSGGPLLDEKGDVIGIVFAGMQQFPGLNFAVPYNWVEKALPALFKGGAAVHPWLGMAVAETEKGLEVIYTVPDEPAAQAGIAAGTSSSP